MANQKANLHNIELRSTDLCLNRFNADVKPWEGFRKNNSPFYGNVLSPFYTKVVEGVGSNNTYIHRDGTIYRIKQDGSLYITPTGSIDESEILKLSSGKFLHKSLVLNSGNSQFNNILAFFDTDRVLCSSISGDLAIVLLSTGEVVHRWLSLPEDRKYKPGSLVSFAYRTTSNSYCFTIGNICYYTSVDGSTLSYIIASSDSPNNWTGIVDNTRNKFIVGLVQGSRTVMYVVDPTSLNHTTINSIEVTVGSSSTRTISGPVFDAFFSRDGRIVFPSRSVRSAESLPYAVYPFCKDLHWESGDVLKATAVTDVSISATTTTPVFQTIDSWVDNNMTLMVVGTKNTGTINTTASTETVREPVKEMRKVVVGATPSGTPILEQKEVVVGYVDVEKTIEAKTKTSPNFHIQLLNASKMWTDVPVSAEGKWEGGTYASLGNGFRVLYNNGTITGVSISSSEGSVGTMLSSSGGVDGDAPITVTNNGNVIIYKNDGGEWVVVESTSDSSKAILTVANDRYLIINSTEYFNCYDVVEGRPNHFAPDFNNRVMLEANYEDVEGGPLTLTSYLEQCESWKWVSGIGSNSVILNTPFISLLTSPFLGLIPKASVKISLSALAGFTPSDLDVDVYYGKEIDGEYPKYAKSIDGNTTYINQKLFNTRWNHGSVTYVPSIFATFENGFLSQGIINDGGHSFLQTYTEGTNAVFGESSDALFDGVEGAFLIQGMYFLIIGGCIYKYYPETGSLSAIINIGAMKLIGSTPDQAILWSNTNRTFYTFVGSNNLDVLVLADEIGEIYYSVFSPNTMSIYVLANTGVYIFGNGQVVQLYEEGSWDRCFILDEGFALTSAASVVYYSYNPLSGFVKTPIILETEFYGQGNGIKSVHDCVYIRLWDPNKGVGTVKINSSTLNEGVVLSETKVFNITPDTWDPNSNTIFLRYQPKNQAATGFSVHIESPFAISTLSMSDNIETVSNSRFNI